MSDSELRPIVKEALAFRQNATIRQWVEFYEEAKRINYLYEDALERADNLADSHKHPTRVYCLQCEARDEYRAVRERTKGV